MRIKKLELVGFKSFKDRTVIHFDAGITGIVGPNGCGKSNIVDALVWVMGEMSAKHLRGSSMEDVIFAGAEGYSPAGLAEVSLVLENDGGQFPAAYAKFSEIMITRRLHRGGESEYLINREPARLRDVQEVFMDTGAGSKGFSIIEQGAIGKIITAKPEDRRSLIEEAAGITKFKVRKRESQRKLQATDQNLVRLQDIVGELRRQIGSLERQAQRAERYRNIKTQIEERDLWVSSVQFERYRTERESAQTELVELETSVGGGAADLGALQAEVAEKRLAHLAREEAVQAAQSRMFQLKSELQDKELLLRELQMEMEQARKSQAMTGSLVAENESRLALLLEEKSRMDEQFGVAQADAEKAAREFLEVDERYREQSGRIQVWDQELTSARRELLTVSQAESGIASREQSLQDQLAQVQERELHVREVFADLEARSTEFRDHRNHVFKSLEKERQLQLDVMRDVETLAANKKTLEGQVGERRLELDRFKDEFNTVASRLYGLENLQANFEGFESGVKSVMLWQKQRMEVSQQAEIRADGHVEVTPVLRPISEVVEVPADLEVAMEAALGARLQVLLSADTDSALAAVEHLKGVGKGRSGFVLPEAPAIGGAELQRQLLDVPGVLGILSEKIQAPEAQQPIVERLLGRTVLVESIRTALSLRSELPGCSFVTRDGDVLDADGVLTGGSAESAEAGLLKRRREIRELSHAKDEWAGKQALAQAGLQKLEAQLQAMARDLENAVKSSTEQEIRVVGLKKDLDRAENELRQAESTLERQKAERDQITAQVMRIEGQLEEARERLTELRSRKLELEDQVQCLDQNLLGARSEVAGLQSQVVALKERDVAARGRAEGLLKQLQMVENSLREVQGQLSRMTSETDKTAQTLTFAGQRLQEERVLQERLISEVQQAETESARVREAFESFSAALRELETRAQDMQNRMNHAQNRTGELRLALEQAALRMQFLENHVRERYVQDLPSVAAQWAAREGDVDLAEKELVELREKISKIGDVNLSAITEFEEIKNRYEFLTQQQEDLNEAKEQLRKVIERINRICSKRFKETFEAVNERFTKVFPVLFGGGEARLILVEDPEKGEMGIDIVAKPPGKKSQNVSLLSGGEKALTAVSLIFAIFLVKPSPYCLLDEVDAPLDDANVARFNELVREMAKRSQIIVVTHNKYTMEVTERLYGVTQQEKGVSKMVSVSLADAQKGVG